MFNIPSAEQHIEKLQVMVIEHFDGEGEVVGSAVTEKPKPQVDRMVLRLQKKWDEGASINHFQIKAGLGLSLFSPSPHYDPHNDLSSSIISAL